MPSVIEGLQSFFANAVSRLHIKSAGTSSSSNLTTTTTTAAAVAATAAVLYYTISSIRSWYRLRHVPGPFLASFSYLWLMRVNARGISSEVLKTLRDRYATSTGGVVRIAPNYVLIDDVASLRRISAPRSPYVRDSWWQGLKMDTERQDNMLTTMDNGLHDKLKGKTYSGYNGRDGVDIESGVDVQLEKLRALIRREYATSTSGANVTATPGKQTVDLVWLVRYFTMDVITSLAYGEAFGYLDANDDLYGFNRQLADMETLVAVMINTPVMRTLINSPLGPWLMPRPTDKDGMGRLIGIGQEFVARHFGEKSAERGTNMVSSFMRHGLSQRQCEAECQVQVIAGADTTGTTIRTAFLFVLSTPRVYNRLIKEIDTAVKDGMVDGASIITYQQARKLPYLQAVIYEAIRMRPPALYGHFKSVPPGGDTVGGVFLPAGTAVGHNLFGIMMSRAIFGADAEMFRPERLLECEPDEKAEMERVIELAFGSGRWLCAGKLVAFTQLSKVIFELLRVFEIQLVNPGKPWDEDSALFWRQQNMLARIMERDALEHDA